MRCKWLSWNLELNWTEQQQPTNYTVYITVARLDLFVLWTKTKTSMIDWSIREYSSLEHHRFGTVFIWIKIEYNKTVCTFINDCVQVCVCVSMMSDDVYRLMFIFIKFHIYNELQNFKQLFLYYFNILFVRSFV